MSHSGPLPKGRYFLQLLATVARVAGRSPTVKAAMLAPPNAERSLHKAIADIRALDRSDFSRSELEGATQAEQLWRKIAAGLGVDLSEPMAPASKSTACVAAASFCAGCRKSASPTRYCGASRGCRATLTRQARLASVVRCPPMRMS